MKGARMPNFELWHIIVTAIVLLFLGGVIGGRIAIVAGIIRADKKARQSAATLLEEAADHIAQGSSQDWVNWSVYLMKALDARIENGYAAALQVVRHSIDVRLERGEWPEEILD
jgi:hypothetical protein